MLSCPVVHAVTGSKAAVVTPDPRATQAALKVLNEGGNAMDALLTAQAVLNVVAPQSSGIGGGASLLYYDRATRAVLYFDGSVRSPAKLFPKMFLDKGGRPLSADAVRTSGLSVGVPGALKLLAEVQARYGSGKKNFGALLAPAITFAEEGMEVSEPLGAALKQNMSVLGTSRSFREIFFRNGLTAGAGDRIRQTDLAETLKLLKKHGPDIFYEGKIGAAVVKAAGAAPAPQSVLTAGDLKNYAIVKQDPLYVSYGEQDLFTAGPPSAGGVMLFASLNLLNELGLSAFPGKPEAVHLLAETMKLTGGLDVAIGDPDFFDLPVGKILSKEWTGERASRVALNKAMRRSAFTRSSAGTRNTLSVSILIIDRYGNIVNYSASMGNSFGSGILVPGYGFFLNDLMLDFDTDEAAMKDPDFPNIPGPRQRPRNFFTPLFVFREGRPVMALSASDGRESAKTVLNLFVQRADFNVPCAGILEVSRVFDRDGVMVMEEELYNQDTWRVQLELWGHKPLSQAFLGEGQMVCFDEENGKLVAESDLRGDLYGAAAV
ncbi:MAG TPA: gamma-glutamyltransferase [Candidatus Omnitrophota bacterium]|jgi:gamma-glutamyltranspeptidase/glutathione hydrolase|nr:gamma-glutamyltransferase [Candidatus Omnitrophota bacterium]